MVITYDDIVNAFLSKITEYEFINMADLDRDNIVSGYMKRSITQLKYICKYNLLDRDDDLGQFNADFNESDVDELIDIISEGMLVQWFKQYVYKQELLENTLNTRDFTTYSPAELLRQIGSAYKKAQADYTQMVREYSYNLGDLTELHI